MSENLMLLEKTITSCNKKKGDSVAYIAEKLPNNYNHEERMSLDEVLECALSGIEIHESLTKSEEEILKLIVAGHTNKTIAKKIYRTERTVEYHRNHIMRKLGTNTAADLVRRAISLELV